MDKQKSWAKQMRNPYNMDGWKKVRFLDKIHFGRGPQRKLLIIRKPGERTCQDCIEEKDEPKEKDKKQKGYHCWAAVGYNFKSKLVFYKVPGNSNRKMSQRVYIDSILEVVVKPWLETGEDFVLEEDGDFGHGSGKIAIVRDWKAEHGLKYYFNCPPLSTSFSPIENCWQISKQTVGKKAYWDDESKKDGQNSHKRRLMIGF